MGNIGTGSGTSYPVSLDAQSAQEVDSPSASKTRLRSAVPNDLIACTLAVETITGTAPQGTKADVKTFLQTQHAAAGTHTSYITTQNDFTLARQIGTIYKNTNNHPIYVSSFATNPALNPTTYQLYTDLNSSPSTLVSSFSVSGIAGTTATFSVFGIVLPGHYYKILGTNMPVLGGWIEWS